MFKKRDCFLCILYVLFLFFAFFMYLCTFQRPWHILIHPIFSPASCSSSCNYIFIQKTIENSYCLIFSQNWLHQLKFVNNKFIIYSFVFFVNASCITNIKIKIINKYTGNNATVIWFAINPKTGGINNVPTYALAICIPIIACDLSAPKCVGVEWIIHG